MVASIELQVVQITIVFQHDFVDDDKHEHGPGAFNNQQRTKGCDIFQLVAFAVTKDVLMIASNEPMTRMICF